MKTSEVTSLVFMFILGTANLFFPVLGFSERDVWVAALTSFSLGLIYAFFLTSFKQPKQYHPAILIILILYTLHLASLVTRNISEIAVLTILPYTPDIVISILSVLVAAYAAANGLTTISYIAVIAIFPTIFIWLLIAILSLP